MRASLKLSSLLIFLVCACNLPVPNQSAPDIPTVTETATITADVTPAQDEESAECGFVWARKPLADLSNQFDEALKDVLPQASGYAEAYGENCISATGEVVRFSAMETDYYVTLIVEDLHDKQTLGEAIAKVLRALTQFPVGETPGPQPGYVGITFESPSEEIRLWFTRKDAEVALENGLRGEELFNALQSN